MQNKTKIKILVGVVAVAIIGILANYIFSEVFSVQGNVIKRIYIRDVLVKAELVKSKTKIELGLGGRPSLSSGRGMFFQMPKDSTQHFWMKEMRFAIDIIWIENNRVIGCEKNISSNDPRTFSSPGDAGYVLEVPEGFCDQNKVTVNDEVKI
ncbi:MAG: DUF192 domain-containing protein [Parcubacteria group bacterium]|jgi:hypothetical protein